MFGLLNSAGDPRVAPFAAAIPPMAGAGKIPAAPGSVVVEIRGDVNDALLGAIGAAKGTVIHQSARWGSITASLPTTALEEYRRGAQRRAHRAQSVDAINVGAVTSQGYVAHEANKTIGQLGYNGGGIKVGVLSDTASPGMISALIGTGDLPVGSTTLPGEDGGAGSDEGTAMMEIVHDVAPGASLLFATAFTSPASFADNILALAAAGCKVIVDDVSWSDEGVFQDSVIAQAVNTVTASGVVYFSSAANSGNLTRTAPAPPTKAIFWTAARPRACSQVRARCTTSARVRARCCTTRCSPPATHSCCSGRTRSAAATTTTTSTSSMPRVRRSSRRRPTRRTARKIRTRRSSSVPRRRPAAASWWCCSAVVQERCTSTRSARPTFATTGATYGHNARANTMSMAAVYWNSAENGTKPFTGAANPTEVFSSDGPRKIFYDPNGAAITPGNFLFGTNGGTTLQKPDLAAADGGSALTPGFNPFFGTSASAPHAAAIAALIRQARPDYTVAQVKAAMTATALDTMGAGVDRDAGYGIAMGYAAVQYALTH